MAIDVFQYECLADNYGYIVKDRQSGLAAAIDVPDADALAGALDQLGWKLALIMNTHWHHDHIGGNDEIRRRTGAVVIGPSEVAQRSSLDREVSEGDVVELGATRFSIIGCGGHTHGHVCYHGTDDGVVFVGDVLFAMGCGRVFEGTPAQMWMSLSKLAALPPQTLVYCAHEYTAANAQFALTVDNDPAVRARAEDVFRRRAKGERTVPTTMELERATNPFLRAPLLRPELAAVEAFALLRRQKDTFRA